MSKPWANKDTNINRVLAAIERKGAMRKAEIQIATSLTEIEVKSATRALKSRGDIMCIDGYWQIVLPKINAMTMKWV